MSLFSHTSHDLLPSQMDTPFEDAAKAADEMEMERRYLVRAKTSQVLVGTFVRNELMYRRIVYPDFFYFAEPNSRWRDTSGIRATGSWASQASRLNPASLARVARAARVARVARAASLAGSSNELMRLSVVCNYFVRWLEKECAFCCLDCSVPSFEYITYF